MDGHVRMAGEGESPGSKASNMTLQSLAAQVGSISMSFHHYLYIYIYIHIYIYMYVCLLDIYNLIYFWLRWVFVAFLQLGEQGLLSSVVFLIAVVSLAVEHQLSKVCFGSFCSTRAQQLQFPGSRAQAQCSEACGIFPDWGWNPYLLHLQVDSLPLSYQESPYSHL